MTQYAFLEGQIVPIKVEHRPIGTGEMGTVVARLRELYFDAAKGRNPKYRHWCQT